MISTDGFRSLEKYLTFINNQNLTLPKPHVKQVIPITWLDTSFPTYSSLYKNLFTSPPSNSHLLSHTVPPANIDRCRLWEALSTTGMRCAFTTSRSHRTSLDRYSTHSGTLKKFIFCTENVVLIWRNVQPDVEIGFNRQFHLLTPPPCSLK